MKEKYLTDQTFSMMHMYIKSYTFGKAFYFESDYIFKSIHLNSGWRQIAHQEH